MARQSKLMSTTMTTVLSVLALSLAACSAPVGNLFYGTLAKGSPVVIVASGVTGGSQAVVAYDTNGTFLENIADLTNSNLTPVGLAPKDGFSFVVALGQAAAAGTLNSFFTTGGYANFVNNSNLNGQLFQMSYDLNTKTYMVIKANTVEGFDVKGNRIGNPFITTTIGACILTTPKAMTMDPVNKRLWVTNTAVTAGLTVYDISNINSPACITKNVSMGANSPLPVVYHDSGWVYSIAQTPRILYAFSAATPTTAGVAVFTDAGNSILTTSTAMAEMPDGTLLIASAGTNKGIDRFQVSGSAAATRVGTTAFIRDVFTAQVNDIMVLKGL